ncbi:MAG: glycosyltransferase [Gammaproteobacteria bacterium]|nr:glycosyltransferase [Gammaproteobacteria bacterium]MDH3411285.1 glycosyltransferase [Gammaproteobacteria bacterium]
MRASSPSEAPISHAKAADGPFVSVGLPVYNGEQFVRGAIDSLLTQSYTNLELIISDNASTDGTAAIAGEYATRDPRVRYFRQPRNIGAPSNWNFVVARARGKYFKWASANDYCDTMGIAACVEKLESDPRVVLCYGTTCLVDEMTGVVLPYDGDFSITEEQPSVRLSHLLAQMKLNNAISGLIRMEVLRRTGLIRPYTSGDLVLMAELAMAGGFVQLPNSYLYRRIGETTLSCQLTDTELRQFLDPRATSGVSWDRLRMNIGYIASVLRASISLGEKLRALTLVAHGAYWDISTVVMHSRHDSGIRP